MNWFKRTPKKAEQPTDPVKAVSSEDPEMNAAINEARANIKTFFDALMGPQDGQTSFLLKVAFTRNDQTEHLWLADLDFPRGKTRGTVANEPAIKGLRFMQVVEYDPAYITDWMYLDHGKLVGGYTTRLIRDRMSPEERTMHDAQAPYKF